MNRFTMIAAAVLTAGFALSTQVDAADLMVTIHQVRSAAGVISVAVYDSAMSFLMEGAQIASADVMAMPGDTPVVFMDLPPGIYAVAAFHDENASGMFDTNFLGLPIEGYGFSNRAMALLGPPAFTDAAVQVDSVASTELVLSY